MEYCIGSATDLLEGVLTTQVSLTHRPQPVPVPVPHTTEAQCSCSSCCSWQFISDSRRSSATRAIDLRIAFSNDANWRCARSTRFAVSLVIVRVPYFSRK